jgi:ribosomal protein S18 acetylase RimI-like enzyme
VLGGSQPRRAFRRARPDGGDSGGWTSASSPPPTATRQPPCDGPTSTILGILDGDALVATAMVGHDGHRGWVYYVAVAGTHRRRGLGARMMDEAERWLRAAGAVKVQLMVRDENPAALAFYEGLGYEDARTTVLARWLVDPAAPAPPP